MLPWEHAAISYLLYTAYSRLRYDEPPHGWAVLVVLFASQRPDLINKPLAWQFGLIPSGRSVAHSVCAGVPVSVLTIGIARRRGVPELGSAFAIGYLSHLATDAVPLYPESSTSFESILWPLRSYEESSEYNAGFLAHTIEIVGGELAALVALEPSLNTIIGMGMVAVTLAVWVLDGTPGISESIRILLVPFRVLHSAFRYARSMR